MRQLVIGLLMSVAAPSALLAAPAPAPAKAPADTATAALIDKAMAGAYRTEAERARDVYRHPRETLLFFGLKPGQTVVEVTPGGGWYTNIIAPVLKEKGHYIAAYNNPDASEAARKQRDAFAEKMKARADQFGDVAVTRFGKGAEAGLAAPGSADMVLTFRNIHNWKMAGFAPDAFRAFYVALKPGGVLGVVEHRLPESRPDNEQTAKSGYVKESDVIRMAEAAGFRLDARSEINANPKDSADWPDGVWTLPPTYALKDADRAKYQAIGESDRMTLRFVKPAN